MNNYISIFSPKDLESWETTTPHEIRKSLIDEGTKDDDLRSLRSLKRARGSALFTLQRSVIIHRDSPVFVGSDSWWLYLHVIEVTQTKWTSHLSLLGISSPSFGHSTRILLVSSKTPPRWNKHVYELGLSFWCTLDRNFWKSRVLL